MVLDHFINSSVLGLCKLLQAVPAVLQKPWRAVVYQWQHLAPAAEALCKCLLPRPRDLRAVMLQGAGFGRL